MKYRVHIYLGSHKVDDIKTMHIHLNKIPRKGDSISLSIDRKYFSAKVENVEWLLDKDNEVNIFLD